MKTVSIPLGETTTLEYTCDNDGQNGGLVAKYGGHPTYESNRFTTNKLPSCYSIHYKYLAEVASKMKPDTKLCLSSMRTLYFDEVAATTMEGIL